MKIKTSQLSGPALDWAVGFGVHSTEWETIRKEMYWYPSVDWGLAGRLIEQYHITLESSLDGTHWSAQCPDKEWPCWHQQEGNGPLEAICRAIVASELGDEVDVPDELGGAE